MQEKLALKKELAIAKRDLKSIDEKHQILLNQTAQLK
jgi:hypothetical protein